MALAQVHAALQARPTGPARTLRTGRVQRAGRPQLARAAVAAAEPEVAEEAPVAAAAAAAPGEEQQGQRRQQRRGGQRGRRPGPKGPDRTLKLADIEVGKTYPGVIVSTVEFGAFVNIGAETDGLLHISQISAGFTRSVADEVQAGQDVQVRVLSVDAGRGKFAVSMLPEGGAAAAASEAAEGSGAAFDRASGERPRQARVASSKKRGGERGGGARAPPPVKAGDVITGRVASTAAFGCFVEVGGGFTGLLHATEIQLPEGSPSWETAIKEGDELQVRVVSVNRDKIALTQRSEEERAEEQRIARQGLQAAADVPEGASALGRLLVRAGIKPESFPPMKAAAAPPAAASAKPAASAAGGISAALVKELRESSGAGMMDCKKALTECNGDIEKAKEFLRKKGLASADKKAGRVAAEGAVWSYIHAGSRLGVLVEVNCETDFVARGEKFKELVNDIAMQVAASPDATVVSVSDVPAEELEKERAIEMEKEDLRSKPEAIREKIVVGRVEKIAKERALLEQPFIKDSGRSVGEVVKEAVASIGENIQIRRFERFTLGETVAKKEAGDFAAEVEAQAKAMQEAAAKKAEAAPAAEASPAAEAKPAVAVSAALVKQLRESSGAGMMDCKKALAESGGDLEAAAEFLRKKGLASADKKAGRVAAEGAVGSYIHAGSRLGVLVEVNCETDFVARGEKFKELVNDIAMQIAACPDVEFVSTADVPAEFLARERAIEMEKEDLRSKPEAIREKIVAGRVEKLAKERALLEQAFIKDTSKTVAEHIKEAVASIGENIQVRRFAKYALGEGVEKKEVDFVAEVAAQTGGKV